MIAQHSPKFSVSSEYPQFTGFIIRKIIHAMLFGWIAEYLGMI
jgi:hypothetical protein